MSIPAVPPAWPGLGSPLPEAFTDAATEAALSATTAVKTVQSERRVIEVSGGDARSFLHGQFTADCRPLTPGAQLFTAWCTPKGRVLYLPQVIATASGFLLLVPAVQADAFVRRLRMFVLRAAVEISDGGAEHGALMVALPEPGAPPPALVECADGQVASSSDARRHWLIGPEATLATAWNALAMPAVGANAARLLAIRAAQPELTAATAEQFLPQELDLDRGTGVSFEKGCYPGQEIVARVRYRGSVKRRLARLGATAGAPPVAGTRLLDAAGGNVGTVLIGAHTHPGAVELLAVLDLDTTAVHVEGDDAEAVVLAR